MKIKILTTLILILSITTLNAQSKVKKGTTNKKSVKKTIVKTEVKEEPEIVDTPIIEEAPESNPLKIKYRRSSLYTAMVEAPNLPYADSIKKYFSTSKVPDKFNDHNLKTKTLQSFSSTEAQITTNDKKTELQLLAKNIRSNKFEDIAEVKKYVESSIKTTEAAKLIKTPHQTELDNIAREMVAKWFNRSNKGGFNMNLIKSRGNYDATVLDIAKARASKRGLTMLGDAGEDLIKNSFVLVNEFKYISKEEVAKSASGFLSGLAQIASVVPGASNISTISSLTAVGVTVAGKGYVVKTKAYLYRLDWNEEVAAKFYNDYWATDKAITPERKRAFDESDLFKLVYIGTDDSWADVQSSIFTNKSDVKLVERATIKAIDAVIVKLQKNHDEFKTKTPLYTGEPITAKIGLKEGLTSKSKFDVLEQQIDENGISKYINVGVIKVDSAFPIWDNRYGADVENPNITTDKTYFKKVSGKDFYPGMLMVQKKGK